MDQQITTLTEQLGANLAPTSAAEPTFSLAQFQALLRDAAAYERAQRPIVLHGPEAATQTAAHGGIDVRVPAPPTVTAQTPRAPRERNPWPLVFTISGCAGVGSSVLAAATGNEFAILAVLTALATWGTATYQLVFVREP
jgi:hypothetical protein